MALLEVKIMVDMVEFEVMVEGPDGDKGIELDVVRLASVAVVGDNGNE